MTYAWARPTRSMNSLSVSRPPTTASRRRAMLCSRSASVAKIAGGSVRSSTRGTVARPRSQTRTPNLTARTISRLGSDDAPFRVKGGVPGADARVGVPGADARTCSLRTSVRAGAVSSRAGGRGRGLWRLRSGPAAPGGASGALCRRACRTQSAAACCSPSGKHAGLRFAALDRDRGLAGVCGERIADRVTRAVVADLGQELGGGDRAVGVCEQREEDLAVRVGAQSGGDFAARAP